MCARCLNGPTFGTQFCQRHAGRPALERGEDCRLLVDLAIVCWLYSNWWAFHTIRQLNIGAH
jgi:hypothetical protein